MVFPEYGLTGAALSEEADRGRARQFMARDMEVCAIYLVLARAH